MGNNITNNAREFSDPLSKLNSIPSKSPQISFVTVTTVKSLTPPINSEIKASNSNFESTPEYLQLEEIS